MQRDWSCLGKASGRSNRERGHHLHTYQANHTQALIRNPHWPGVYLQKSPPSRAYIFHPFALAPLEGVLNGIVMTREGFSSATIRFRIP